MKKGNSRLDKSCPYLGMINDPKTSTMYPTSDNTCHQIDPPAPIILQYQSSCCLQPSHVDCTGFKEGWKNGFPKNLRSQKKIRSNNSFPSWTLFLGLGALIFILVIGAMVQITGSNVGSIIIIEGGLIQETTTKALQPSNTNTPINTSNPTNTIEPTSAMTLTPTLIPTQTPGPSLKTPFGSNGVTFAVHEVLPGETMGIIASTYNTNPNVLETINQLVPPERTRLWPGDLLVVCVNCGDHGELPKLQAIYVESQVSVSELAEIYNTSKEELTQWNNLGESDQIDAPRWIIVKAN